MAAAVKATVDARAIVALMCVSCVLFCLSHFIACFQGLCDQKAYHMSNYTERHNYVAAPVAVFGTLYAVCVRALQALYESRRPPAERAALRSLGLVFAVGLLLYLSYPHPGNAVAYAVLHTAPVILSFAALSVWVLVAVVRRPRDRWRTPAIAAVALVGAAELLVCVETLLHATRTGFAHFLTVIESALMIATLPLIAYAASSPGARPASASRMRT